MLGFILLKSKLNQSFDLVKISKLKGVSPNDDLCGHNNQKRVLGVLGLYLGGKLAILIKLSW